MIGIVNICYIFIYSVPVPFFIGMILTGRTQKYCDSIAASLATGVMMMLALFELLAVPMILLKCPFHLLENSWKIAVWIFVLLSIIINFKKMPVIFRKYFKNLILASKTEVLIWAAAVVLILFQTYMVVGHMRVDTDDARFVAEAMESYEMDTMLQYHPITGEYLAAPVGEMVKDMVSPFPIFMALAGSLFRLPPAVAVHVFFPLLFIPFAYVIYYLLGDYLLHGNKKYVALFLFFLCLIHCFAYESIYAAGYTLLAVTWQGRSILAMIALPFIWYLLMRLMDRDADRRIEYAMLWCAVLAGCLTSSMSVQLIPILTGTYALASCRPDRSAKMFVMLLLCIVPCLLCYCLYYRYR